MMSISVSYTHLDVYKRQGVDVIEDNSGTSTIQFGEGIHLNDLTAMKVGDDLFFLISGTADRLVAVSYTHLDVYKRQPII